MFLWLFYNVMDRIITIIVLLFLHLHLFVLIFDKLKTGPLTAKRIIYDLTYDLPTPPIEKRRAQSFFFFRFVFRPPNVANSLVLEAI